VKSIVTKDPGAVEGEARSACAEMFPNCDQAFVADAFAWARECFEGRFKDYQAIDTRYHDFEHTLQGTLCLVRLLRERHLAGTPPVLSQREFQLGLLAILLHDTGYLKKRQDVEGTGAKYTVTHVRRSAEFAAELLGEKGFSAEEIRAVQNMIRCTGLESALSSISFQSQPEKVLGQALATSDLLGQMAADDYVTKLGILYEEFAEAARYDEGNGFVASFVSAEDLKRKTPIFWQTIVREKLEKDFERLYRFLNRPFPDGRNEYLSRIDSNMARLQCG
jgi:predicted metal-dependent HD superfamily phosphohydrolase